MSTPQDLHDPDAEDKPTNNHGDPPVEEDATMENNNENAEVMTNSSSSGSECITTAIVAPPSTPSREHVYDPNKISLKFIFANRDGVNVILDCKPSSTVAEVKGALLSVWPKGEDTNALCFFSSALIQLVASSLLDQPKTFSTGNHILRRCFIHSFEEMPSCSSGEKIRLICMGKGMLSPDSKTLESAGVPVFKTHPTPINVAVRPENLDKLSGKKGSPMKSCPGSPVGGGNTTAGSGMGGPRPVSTGCSCAIL